MRVKTPPKDTPHYIAIIRHEQKILETHSGQSVKELEAWLHTKINLFSDAIGEIRDRQSNEIILRCVKTPLY